MNELQQKLDSREVAEMEKLGLEYLREFRLFSLAKRGQRKDGKEPLLVLERPHAQKGTV